MEEKMIGVAGLVTRELSRGHAVEERPNKPQRREERGEKRKAEGAHPCHLSVIFDRVTENGLPQRSSRLCGSFGPAPTE